MTHSTLPAWTAWAVSHDREVHFYSVILGFLGTGALTNPEGSQPNWLKCPVQQGRRPLHYPSRNPTEQRPPVPINPESVLSPPSTLVRARTHTHWREGFWGVGLWSRRTPCWLCSNSFPKPPDWGTLCSRHTRWQPSRPRGLLITLCTGDLAGTAGSKGLCPALGTQKALISARPPQWSSEGGLCPLWGSASQLVPPCLLIPDVPE
jgi:hypothetical protein